MPKMVLVIKIFLEKIKGNKIQLRNKQIEFVRKVI